MTATAGLHSLPADLRPAVVAEPGHVFVRADLGQIEPRVLAAVSGDEALARATPTDDLYAPVAAQLGVDRPTAKVAVLGAMYGQTTGHGAQALRRLEPAYPVAMDYLRDADEAGQVGRNLRTYGGRLIRIGSTNANEVTDRDARAHAAAMGRYGRNAMVQGAAAELFKRWAVTVRARLAGRAEIVLCLHDELLVHAPAADGAEVARLVDDGLQEAAAGWAPPTAGRRPLRRRHHRRPPLVRRDACRGRRGDRSGANQRSAGMRIDNDGVGLEVVVDGPRGRAGGAAAARGQRVDGDVRLPRRRATRATACTGSTSAATGARTGRRGRTTSTTTPPMPRPCWPRSARRRSSATRSAASPRPTSASAAPTSCGRCSWRTRRCTSATRGSSTRRRSPSSSR